jgi:hypothetical protein
LKAPGQNKMYKTWTTLWKNKWKTAPYNTLLFEHFMGNFSAWAMQTYWLMSVIERAQSTNADKIAAVWENDSYKMDNGKILKMRACDHKVMQDLAITEFVPPDQQKVAFNIPPYYFYKGASSYGPVSLIPAARILPWMDPKLERCRGKNGWGE